MNKIFFNGLVSVLLVTFLLGLLSPVYAAIGGRPANPDEDNPRSNDIFIYTLEKGETKNDAVIISNNSDTRETIELYAVDSLLTNTGAFTCEQRIETRDSVGAWIEIDDAEVTLNPGENLEVPFTITAPSRVDVGEHNGCIAFEIKGDEGTIDGNVRIRPRTAVRVAATVPGELQRNVEIASFTAERRPDVEGQLFTMKVKSSGNVSTDVTMNVELRSLFGVRVYENEGTYPVLADTTYEAQFVHESPLFWGGWYTANGSISYNTDPGTFGVDDNENTIQKTANSIRIFVTPAPGAIVVYAAALLAVACVIAFLWFRRYEKHDALRNWHTYTVKEKDTIKSIAESRDIGWKKLAKINSIKAPFVLQEGQSLKVPKKIKRSK